MGRRTGRARLPARSRRNDGRARPERRLGPGKVTTMRLRCQINGEDFDREVDPRLLLVELVRDVAGLKGTRIGCLTGDCGACTLRLDGKVVKACLLLALSAEGRRVTTIKGAEDLAEIQSAFVAENGFQSGYCTTGIVLTAAELLQ